MRQKRAKVKKGIACLVLFMILMSMMPAALAQDALDDTAESKHIQEQAAAKEFRSRVHTVNIAASGGSVDEDPFNYQGKYILDETKLNSDERNALSHVQKYAKEQKVSPALLMAIIKKEDSSFDPNEIGDGGLAIGYMQLHWDAAYDAGYRSARGGDTEDEKKTYAREDWPSDGLDPDTNIKYGCSYLKIVYNQWGSSSVYGDSLKNAISAYNLGRTHGPDKSNENSYVSPVLTNYEEYKSKYTPAVTIAAVSTYNTILDDLNELVTKGKIPGYDLYTDSNIDQLWANLDQYKILLIDEDCIFEWTNPCDPSCNKPIPTTTVGLSFYNHKAQLGQWTFNGGGLFCTDQNDVSPDYLHNVWWTWLPDELQVESNEFPSDYPDIGYGHYPENLEIISDPWIFSTPNEIDITKVDKDECHGRFTFYPGYTALVRDKSDGDILEVYREYGSGVVVLSHVEYETAHPYDVDYIENEINFVKPERKEINLKLYIEDAIAGRVEGSPPVVNKAPGDIIDMVAQIENEEDESYNVDVTVEVPSGLIYKKCFSRADFTDIEESQKTPVISGNKYTVTINLGKSGTKEASKQIVWRFKIPEDAATTDKPTVTGEVKVNGEICDKSDTRYSMAANVKAIIVTNRYLLFKKYGDPAKGSSKDVEDLLNYLYQIGDSGDQNCIIYYIDKWDETPNQIIKDWDNTKIDYDAGEETINTVVKAIDNLAESWISRSSPGYFILLGDDRILPHYRVNDADYTNEETKPEYKVTALNLPDQATLYALANNYFISDNIYGDTDGEDIDKGKLEIVASRIVGMSASEMKRFIERGIKGPSINNKAIVASQTEHPLWFQWITSG